MLFLYRLLFLPALAVLSPRWFLHALRRGGYRRKFWQRLGFFPKMPVVQSDRRRLWIQAVSVGELHSIRPLVGKLLADGRYELVITTTTSTGLRVAEELFGGDATVGVFPLDFFPCSRLAWRRIRPDCAVLIDSELWPEHISRARARSVPVIVVNGRMSDRSHGRHARFPQLFRTVARGITAVFPGDGASARHFIDLGMGEERVRNLGNLKCDRQPLDDLTDRERGQLLLELGIDPRSADGPVPLLFACSTWPGEEEFALDALAELQRRNPHWCLAIAPRHGERRREIRKLLDARGMSAHFRSDGPAAGGHRVAVIDTAGELGQLIRCGTVALLGKTLPPNGGAQSPIDAIAAGVPLVSGPNVGNFRGIVDDLVRRGAAIVGTDRAEVGKFLSALGEDGARRLAMKAAGHRWLREQAGAAERVCAAIGNVAFPSERS